MSRVEIQTLQRQVADLMRQSRQYWPVPPMGGNASASPPPLYMVVGGNLLYAGLSMQLSGGIMRRTDTVAGSEMPVGTGGAPGDTVTVPAYPIPTSLPNGVGVGVHAFTNAYAFIVNDSRGAFPGDIPLGRRSYCAGSVNLDRVSGGITYRYPCLLIAAAY